MVFMTMRGMSRLGGQKTGMAKTFMVLVLFVSTLRFLGMEKEKNG